MTNEMTDKKKKILQCASELLNTNGNMTIREISKMSGVNVASINYYFGGKEQLMNEIEKNLLHRIMELIGRVQSSLSRTDIEQIFVDELYDFVHENRGFFRVMSGERLSQKQDYVPHLLNESIFKGDVKHFFYRLLTSQTGITDQRELENRCMIFYSGISASIMTDEEHHNLMDKERFASYTKTLLKLIFSNP